jgi:hypothetical protein
MQGFSIMLNTGIIKTIMPDGTAILDNPVTKPIVIPEGKMAAPGDYRVIPVRVDINGRPRNIDLVKQTRQGNCAEYTVLDTVLIAQAAGYAINPQVAEYLSHNPNFNLDRLESDFVIPFLLNAQEAHTEQPTTSVDVDNLGTKIDNPQESLTKANSVLLFREALSPVEIKFDSTDQIANQSDIQRMRSSYLTAIFMGASNHATSMLKLGDQYLHIDPYFNQNIVKVLSEPDALSLLQRTVAQPGSIVTMNPLCTK